MVLVRHPVEVLVERQSAGTAGFALGVLVLAVGVLLPDGPAFGIALGVAVLAWVTADVDGAAAEPEIEVERRKYVEGKITLAEFESRAETILDGRRQELRDRVEDVNGIGPATSTSIAEEFRSLSELRGASVDELKRIHGVGPSTAETLVDDLDLPADKLREERERERFEDGRGTA